MADDEAFKCRSEDRSVFELGIFSSRYGLAATVIVMFSLFLAVYAPLRLVLETVSLTTLDWSVIVLASIAPVEIVEGFKYLGAYAASPAAQSYTR